MKTILSIITICIAFNFSCFSHQHVKNELLILQEAERLPQEGILQQASDGFVYLKVSDDYVYKLFPLLEEKGFNIPNSFNRDSPIRAHISVMYKDDGERLSPITQLGETFSFSPIHVVEVRNGSKEYIIIEVHAPALDILRSSYGLPPKIMHHEFHITIAEKHVH